MPDTPTGHRKHHRAASSLSTLPLSTIEATNQKLPFSSISLRTLLEESEDQNSEEFQSMDGVKDGIVEEEHKAPQAPPQTAPHPAPDSAPQAVDSAAAVLSLGMPPAQRNRTADAIPNKPAKNAKHATKLPSFTTLKFSLSMSPSHYLYLEELGDLF
ncbi:hypothetical protein Cgig2_017238 [Carnegiea gigantea]|uniref:Uncharacterized protein n=1 Tax=Carnegiea gigantea TaxID=171969 RepID=A0A9Q1GUG9_9CARY|nr:hypothetical protein Cgig2_017238 [Carnegiea gigantea]